MADRPNTVPIHDAIAGTLGDENDRWTYPMPDEYRLALARAVTKRLQEGGMLNYNRPWELVQRELELTEPKDSED